MNDQAVIHEQDPIETRSIEIPIESQIFQSIESKVESQR